MFTRELRNKVRENLLCFVFDQVEEKPLQAENLKTSQKLFLIGSFRSSFEQLFHQNDQKKIFTNNKSSLIYPQISRDHFAFMQTTAFIILCFTQSRFILRFF